MACSESAIWAGAVCAFTKKIKNRCKRLSVSIFVFIKYFLDALDGSVYFKN